MIKILLLLIVAYSTMSAQLQKNEDPYKFFEYFKGEWSMLYSAKGGEQESAGRGIAKGTLFFQDLGVELDIKARTLTDTILIKLLINFDKTQQKYSMVVLNSAGNPSTALHGGYDELTKSYVFSGFPVDYDKSKIKIKTYIASERQDKYSIVFTNTYYKEEEKKVVEEEVLRYVFVKL